MEFAELAEPVIPIAEEVKEERESGRGRAKEGRGVSMHEALSNNIQERFEALNAFERRVKALDYRMERVHKSKSFAIVSEPEKRREIKLAPINAEFKQFEQFYEQLNRDREGLKVRGVSNDFVIKSVHKVSKGQTKALRLPEMAQQQLSQPRMPNSLGKQLRQVREARRQAVPKIVSRTQLVKRMQNILGLMPHETELVNFRN